MEGGVYLWEGGEGGEVFRSWAAALVDGDRGHWRRVWLEVVLDEGVAYLCGWRSRGGQRWPA